MERSRPDREVVLPAAALAALRDAVAGQAGQGAADAALRSAGVAAGERLFEETESELGRSLADALAELIGNDTSREQLFALIGIKGTEQADC